MMIDKTTVDTINGYVAIFIYCMVVVAIVLLCILFTYIALEHRKREIQRMKSQEPINFIHGYNSKGEEINWDNKINHEAEQLRRRTAQK